MAPSSRRRWIPIVNGTLTVEGLPVPEWTITDHIDTMNKLGVGYATLSITAPGVYFLAEERAKAKKLAREINEALHAYTVEYPTRLGGLCLLPLPRVEDALAEIEVCIISSEFVSRVSSRQILLTTRVLVC
jgi:predicted TIM-barrel fold metal-dependent hydrolase